MTTSASTFSRRRGVAALAAATCGLLLCAAGAQASSIVYIKRGDVWLSKPDGSGARALTSDGTARNSYRSPSQSDSGTIVALKGPKTLHVLDRRGRRLRKPRSIIAPRLRPYAPVAFDVRISPNGRLIAFTLQLTRRDESAGPGGPQGEDLGTQVWVTKLGTSRAINVERTPQSPSWVGNQRFLVFTPFIYHTTDVWTVAVRGTNTAWFQDREPVDPLDPTDGEPLNHGELTRAGDGLVVVRGPNTPILAAPTSLRVYAVRGLASRPVERCDLRTASRVRYESPSWAPDGRGLVWTEATGIWTTTIAPGTGDCAAAPRLLVAGAGQPDWGPAGVPRRRR